MRVTTVGVTRHAGVSTASASKVLRNTYGASESTRALRPGGDERARLPSPQARAGHAGAHVHRRASLSNIENPFFSLIVEGISGVISPPVL